VVFKKGFLQIQDNLAKGGQEMKKFWLLLIFLLAIGFTFPAMAAEFTFNGDFNNRFQLYTNQNGFFVAEQQGVIRDKDVNDNFGEAKYRLWTEAATNDGDIKGVFAVEIGGLRFGEEGKGAEFSGDGVNIETRWLYTDFQIPFVEGKNRLQMGLNSQTFNQYFWAETVMGVKNYGSFDPIDYELAWFRPIETNANTDDNEGEDLDAFYGRINSKPGDNMSLGFFAMYLYKDDFESRTVTRPDPVTGVVTRVPASQQITDRKYEIKQFARDAEFSMYTIGVDGGYNVVLTPGKLFFKWDAIYQGGEIKNAVFATTAPGDQSGTPISSPTSRQNFDVNAYFLHLDAGFSWDRSTLTYTFWYASGDDDPDDSDFEGYLAVDVDSFDNHVLFESLTDDDVFTERHYMLDKGFIMNKLRFDYKATDRLKVGAAMMYMMTAEDIEYIDNNGNSQSEDAIGFEIDADMSYTLFQGLTFNLAAGYLFAGDAMDYFEEDADGNSDEDIFRLMSSIRYKF